MAARPEATRTAGLLSTRSEQRQAERLRVFDEVFAAHWLSVTRHVECYLFRDTAVHETVAEVFQIAWERMRPGRAPGLPRLLCIADRVLRGHRREIRDAVAEQVHRKVVPDRDEASTLDRQDILRAVMHLRDRDRRVVVLTYWDGLSITEVAEVLRSRPGAVRVSLRRARITLRDALEVDRSGDVVG